MKKKRNSVYDKFEIKRKGTIEENIDKLKEDLGVYLEGAEDIKYDKEKEEKFISPVKREKTEDHPPSDFVNSFTEKGKIQKEKINVELKFNKKLLIIPFLTLLLLIIFMKVAIFKYETAPKKDIDIPGIEIKSIFYYNIFGKKIKEKTILIIGNKTVIIPISAEKWISLPEEKKLKYLKVFQKE
ncbi:hypothetical protein J7K25_06950 [bacterium]|nr:hypothetical protein [bacterium]